MKIINGETRTHEYYTHCTANPLCQHPVRLIRMYYGSTTTRT